MLNRVCTIFCGLTMMPLGMAVSACGLYGIFHAADPLKASVLEHFLILSSGFGVIGGFVLCIVGFAIIATEIEGIVNK